MKLHYILLLIPLFFFQCKKTENNEYNIKRFDIALVSTLENTTDSTLNLLEKEFSPIFNIYYSYILKGNTDSIDLKSKIRFIADYINNPNFKKLYSDVQNEFKDMNNESIAINNAMNNYMAFFEESYTPDIYTHISPFGHSVITTDSLISVSLDSYMGSNYEGYKGILYNYQLPKKERYRMVSDIFRGWLYAKFPFQAKSLIEGMIYEGAIIIAIENIVGNIDAGNIIGYNKDIIKWCEENEDYIWNAILKSNHLYSNNHITYSKYMNEAPFCSALNNNIPAEIGKWIGYKIVSKYADKHGTQSIKDILSGKINVVEILKLYR